MALTNYPTKSIYQVGETVYFLNETKGDSAEIVKVTTSVNEPGDNGTGVQENIYYLKGIIRGYRETELFHSMNALMFNIKGDYLSNTRFLILESGNNDLGFVDFSYTNFEGSQFSGCNFTSADFEGANFSNVNFTNTNLTSANMQKTILSEAILVGSFMLDVSLTDANINGADCRGAIFTNAILPANANTKSSFKSVVGTGHWDPVTTIWTDGLPIGN